MTDWPHNEFLDFGDYSYPNYPIPGILNADGSISTERSITEFLPGHGWVNLPTVQYGKRISPEEAVDLYMQWNLLGASGPYQSMEEAVRQAQFRSQMKALTVKGLLDLF